MKSELLEAYKAEENYWKQRNRQLWLHLGDKNTGFFHASDAEEIKEALFSINLEKAPGPDGFSACFFQSNWGIVGRDMIREVQEFFISGYCSLQCLLQDNIQIALQTSPTIAPIPHLRDTICSSSVLKS